MKTESDLTGRHTAAQTTSNEVPHLVTPRHGEIETRLMSLWNEIFGDDYQINPNDNFFEAGMQSLDATRFILKIRNDFKTDISLKKLYQYSTMKSLGDYLLSRESENVLSS